MVGFVLVGDFDFRVTHSGDHFNVVRGYGREILERMLWLNPTSADD